MIDLTVCVGIDQKTAEMFNIAAPTWHKNRPEMWDMPWVIFYDCLPPNGVADQYVKDLIHNHFNLPQAKLVRWAYDPRIKYESQRERMLTGWVLCPPKHVQTKWWMKIDADVLALEKSDWLLDEWFEPDEFDRLPVWVAPRWHYSKGVGFLDRLERWADRVPPLAKHPRLNIPHKPDQLRVRHSRMCSWVSYYLANWTRIVANYCEQSCPLGKIPVPSQDTTIWYVSARRGDFYRKANQKKVKWTNCSRINSLREMAAEVLKR